MDDRLYMVVDYILNHAQDQDVEVILKAVKKRYEDRERKGAMGLKPGQMAREMAGQISQQMGFSREMIRKTVQDLARQTIMKNAPELTPEQVEELTEAWIPEPGQPGKRGGKSGKGNPPELPRDALMVMVEQFLRYSAGEMPASEQVRLEEEIPGWKTQYWERFSPELRQILSLYLKGIMKPEDFEQALEALLGEAPER